MSVKISQWEKKRKQLVNYAAAPTATPHTQTDEVKNRKRLFHKKNK